MNTTLSFRHSALYRSLTPEQRWWANIEVVGRCWIWQGRPNGNSYGVLRVKGKTTAAHRFGYELLVGTIPDNLELDHLCRNRLCVRPEHLEPVTTRVNILRGMGRGAIEARMTDCKYGHPLSGENLYIRPSDGKRRCRQCNREKCKLWRNCRTFGMTEAEYAPMVQT